MTSVKATLLPSSMTSSMGLDATSTNFLLPTELLLNDTDEFNKSSIFHFESVTNNTTNATEEVDEIDLLQNVPVQLFISLLYLIFFVLGILGNSLVCFVVFRQKAMQTVTNFFIANLAIADILLCLLCIPFTPLYTFLGNWIFGSALCFLVAFAQGCCVYLSTLTLTSIAIDRFFVIIFPFRPRMKITTCLLIIVLIWIVACMLTFPYGYYMITVEKEYKNEVRTLCEEEWPSEDSRKVFGAVTCNLQFFIPFIIILICYLCIFCKLKNNKKKLTKSKNSKKKKENSERALKKKTTTNQMLVLMVILFGMCWLPLNLINILEDFYMKTVTTNFYHLLFFLSHLIAMSSVIYNPFLYAWLNDNFRKEFRQILPCFFLKISGNSAENRRSILINAKNDENLLKNGNEKTCQESTYYNSMQKSVDVEGTTLAMTNDTKQDEILINIEQKDALMNSVNVSKNNNKIVNDDILLSDIKHQQHLNQPPVTNTTKLESGILETTIG